MNDDQSDTLSQDLLFYIITQFLNDPAMPSVIEEMKNNIRIIITPYSNRIIYNENM